MCTYVILVNNYWNIVECKILSILETKDHDTDVTVLEDTILHSPRKLVHVYQKYFTKLRNRMHTLLSLTEIYKWF